MAGRKINSARRRPAREVFVLILIAGWSCSIHAGKPIAPRPQKLWQNLRKASTHRWRRLCDSRQTEKKNSVAITDFAIIRLFFAPLSDIQKASGKSA
jgi:hypothetical protein